MGAHKKDEIFSCGKTKVVNFRVRETIASSFRALHINSNNTNTLLLERNVTTKSNFGPSSRAWNNGRARFYADFAKIDKFLDGKVSLRG